ncbi:hypothetical protein THASP1DRAFT_11852, partial [Thamnocephalis sphaerospora]
GHTYDVARILLSLALWGWFKETRVLGRENIPYRKPVILTHTNMVMDPLVLGVHMPYGRQLHFWAKSTLFSNKFAAALLTALGAVPVDRKNKDNASLFAGTIRTLRNSGVMAIFPEGTSYTLPHMMQLRDGLSWAALQHALEMDEAGDGQRTATIVPAGITYVHKQKWRSMAIIMYGAPMDVTSYLAEFRQEPRSAVKRLTRDIDTELHRVTINARDWDTMHAAEMARTLLVPDEVVLAEDYVKLMQSLVSVLQDLDDHPDVVKLQTQLVKYRSLLETLRLSDLDIASFAHENVGVIGVTVSLVARSLKLLVDLPLFLPGLLFHFPIFLIARAVDRLEPYEECKAQDKVFASIAVLPILYGLLFRYLWSFSNYSVVGLLVAVSLTVTFIVYHTALVDDRYEHFTSVVAAWRMFKAV